MFYLLKKARIPFIAYVIYLYIADDIEQFFTKPRRRAKLHTSDHEVEQRDGVQGEHTEYVTDALTAYKGNAEPCDTSSGNATHPVQDALFLVCTAVANWKNRDYMRKLYATPANTKPYRIKLIFLVGVPKNVLERVTLEKEDAIYKDMVLGPFGDSYSNLTYKTVMGYRWALENCKGMELILKIDDDVYVDVFKFFEYFLPLIPKRKRTLHCFLNFNPVVFRAGKYRVTREEYKHKHYPNFCSGFFVVPTADILEDYFSMAKSLRFFRLEDVFSYALVREALLDVQAIHLDIVTHEWNEWEDCVRSYHYGCKFMAVEVPEARELQNCMERTVELRQEWGSR